MTMPLPPAMQQVVDRLLGLLAQDGCSDAAFDAMAVELFALQYGNDEPYRRFCQRRGITPRRVAGWRDIPPVPISAFKDATLSCIPAADCERVFMTSGTTRGDVKGRNHHPTIAVWDRSMQRNFARHVMAGLPRIRMLTLFPDERELQNSSLARYLSLATRTFGTGDSRAYVTVGGGLDVDGVCEALAQCQARGEPVAVLGATFSFVHLLDAMAARGLRFSLPSGSRLLDTGGYKGQSRELALDAFYDALAQGFGVARERCINMYGMTELSSQFYDAGNAVVPSVKVAPHWVRTRVLDPLTGLDMPPGQRGVLAHCDLANFNAATTILTEDVGIAVDGGFLLLGRAEGAEAKGCSLAVQDFLEAARA